MSKALVAWSIAKRYGKPLAYAKFQKMTATMRTVAEALDEIGAACPTRISLDVAERSAEIIRAGGGTASAVEQRLEPLWVIARTLNEAGIPQVFFDWSPGGRPASVRRARARPEASHSLTTDEVEAIVEAWRRATRPDHRITVNVLALLCCAPARISEVLVLPTDCELVEDPGDGLRAGLRWRPAKGGRPQVKYVPEAMLPVARKALADLREITEPARVIARRIMDGELDLPTPKGWPVLDPESGLTYDRALMVAEAGTMALATYQGGAVRGAHRAFPIVSITYNQLRDRLTGREGLSTTVFDELGIALPDGSPVRLNTHKPRHYLNTIANKAAVPQADIALWSGRRSMRQNAAYDHETPEELFERARKTVLHGGATVVPIDDSQSFDVALLKETAHTTPFGWCRQSLRQDPCHMFGECLNCTQLVCVKGADGKLANIERELERTRALRDKAHEKAHGKMTMKGAWLELFDRKIARLEQLVAVLRSDDVVEGSFVAMAGLPGIPQFDPVLPGKQLASREEIAGSERNSLAP